MPSNKERLKLQKIGHIFHCAHTFHCAMRILCGDGECECNKGNHNNAVDEANILRKERKS